MPASHTAARHRYPATAVATQDRRGGAAAGRARLRRPPVHVEVPRGYGSSQHISRAVRHGPDILVAPAHQPKALAPTGRAQGWEVLKKTFGNAFGGKTPVDLWASTVRPVDCADDQAGSDH